MDYVSAASTIMMNNTEYVRKSSRKVSSRESKKKDKTTFVVSSDTANEFYSQSSSLDDIDDKFRKIALAAVKKTHRIKRVTFEDSKVDYTTTHNDDNSSASTNFSVDSWLRNEHNRPTTTKRRQKHSFPTTLSTVSESKSSHHNSIDNYPYQIEMPLELINPISTPESSLFPAHSTNCSFNSWLRGDYDEKEAGNSFNTNLKEGTKKALLSNAARSNESPFIAADRSSFETWLRSSDENNNNKDEHSSGGSDLKEGANFNSTFEQLNPPNTLATDTHSLEPARINATHQERKRRSMKSSIQQESSPFTGTDSSFASWLREGDAHEKQHKDSIVGDDTSLNKLPRNNADMNHQQIDAPPIKSNATKSSKRLSKKSCSMSHLLPGKRVKALQL